MEILYFVGDALLACALILLAVIFAIGFIPVIVDLFTEFFEQHTKRKQLRERRKELSDNPRQ